MAGCPVRPGKKLIEAARYWAGIRKDGIVDDDEAEEAEEQLQRDVDIIEQLRQLNAPADVVSTVQERIDDKETAKESEDDAFELWAESCETWDFFILLVKLGQWEYIIGPGSAVRVGIPAERITAAMEGEGVPPTKRRRMFREISEIVYAVRVADGEVAAIKKRRK